MRSLRSAAPLLLALLVAAPADTARACINGTMPVTDGWTWEVQKAEKALALGDYPAAARRALELFPDLMKDTEPSERAELVDRSRRVLALAIARADVPLVRAEIARDAAFEWAARALERRYRAAPDDPSRASDLAEALARRAGGRARAYALLADLARADLMPEPRGWAVLATLARDLGHSAIRRIAADHCRQIASQGWVCDVPPLT